MSSLTRRMQIRGMKRRGFFRTPFRIERDADGQQRPVRVKSGGLILNPFGALVGYRWPRSAVV